MEQEDITQIYETLAPMAGQYANAQAEQIGQAQQSMGPLAANTMGTTTAGLGNYTYNRLMRPQVDVMRDEILVEGYRNKLNQALSNAYKTAQRNYSRRSGGGGRTGGGGSYTSGGGNAPTQKKYTNPSSNSDSGSKKFTDTVSTLPSSAKSGEYNVGTATVNGETRIVTKNDKDNHYRISGVGSWRPGSKIWEEIKQRYNVKLNRYPGSDVWTIFGAM